MDKQLLDMITERQFGFATGVALLAVFLPPKWSEWLSGDLEEYWFVVLVPATAAVVRGILWLLGQITGICMDVLRNRKGKKETE